MRISKKLWVGIALAALAAAPARPAHGVARAEHYLPAHLVTTSASPSSGGSTTGDGVYNSGATATVTATANRGYTFSSWVDRRNALVSTSASYSFAVTENRSLIATFTRLGDTARVATAR